MPNMLPWSCFSITSTTTSSSSSSSAVKLVMCTGQIKTFHRPVLASVLMSEHPSHLVCRSDSFLVGQKVPTLDEKDFLELGQSYFLLPSKIFNSIFSLVSIASLFSPSDRVALLQMVEIQRNPSGKLRIRVGEEFMERSDDVDKEARGRVCSTAELERDYKVMVKKKGEVWKPKLETIKEKKEKNSTKRDKKNHRHAHPPPPPPPPPQKVGKNKNKEKEKEKRNPKVDDKAMDGDSSAPPPSPPSFPVEKKTKSSKIKSEKIRSQDKKDPSLPPPPPPTPKSKKKHKDKENQNPESKDEAKESDNQCSSSLTPPPPPPPPPPPSLPKEKKTMKSKIKKEKIQSEDKKDPPNQNDQSPPPRPPPRWSMANPCAS